MSFVVFAKSKPWSVIGLGLGAIALTSATGFYVLSQTNQTAPTNTTVEPSTIKRIAALGRIEPEAEVIHLGVPVVLDGDRVAALNVRQGDRVQAEQIIAVLDSRDRLQDAVQQAQEQVRVAEAKLAQIQAGAKSGEIQAQEATIARLQAQRAGELAAQTAEIDRWDAEVRTAQAELNRFAQLHQEGAISASNFDNKRLAFETARAQLHQAKAKQSESVGVIDAQIQEARATLDRIAEVRPVDVQAARAEVSSAIAQVKRAQTELEKAFIRAPISGQILKIHTRIGEKVSDSGIVDLAQTDQMVAIAEVYQSDIGNVKVGQAAVVTGQAFAGELPGKVAAVGLQVNKQNVFSNQPGENLDRRIVEVKIRLNPQASKQVSSLTNLQVQTVIMLD
jgi:HlyD family secretion protein